MQDQTPRLSLSYLYASQADKHVMVNSSLNILDTLVHCSALSARQTIEPSSPSLGDTYVLDNQPIGPTWSLLAKNQILTWLNGAWQTLKPSVGQRVFLQDTVETIVFNDGQWMLAKPIYSSAQLCSNGAFQIWQRGQSFVGPRKSGNPEFVADRWFSVNSGSQSIIVKAQFEDKNWL